MFRFAVPHDNHHGPDPLRRAVRPAHRRRRRAVMRAARRLWRRLVGQRPLVGRGHGRAAHHVHGVDAVVGRIVGGLCLGAVRLGQRGGVADELDELARHFQLGERAHRRRRVNRRVVARDLAPQLALAQQRRAQQALLFEELAAQRRAFDGAELQRRQPRQRGALQRLWVLAALQTLWVLQLGLLWVLNGKLVYERDPVRDPNASDGLVVDGVNLLDQRPERVAVRDDHHVEARPQIRQDARLPEWERPLHRVVQRLCSWHRGQVVVLALSAGPVRVRPVCGHGRRPVVEPVAVRLHFGLAELQRQRRLREARQRPVHALVHAPRLVDWGVDLVELAQYDPCGPDGALEAGSVRHVNLEARFK
mmetsp:Transcript_29231/g.100931  ORF Transcript_29231/g.100931 Transcript_29231/m.100931 type:complete len:363 (+) Transcript_29231:1926-3014(+)